MGTFARVYKTSDGYAAKFIHKSRLKNKNMTQHLKTEIDLHRQLDHPNIAKLKSVHETNHYVILKMEYVNGYDLYSK